MDIPSDRKKFGYGILFFFFIALFSITSSHSSDYWPTAGCTKSDLDPRLPDQVISLETLAKNRIAAYVVDIEDNVSLKDFGPKYFLPKFKDFAPNIRDVSIISNKEIVLKGNDAAYRMDIIPVALRAKCLRLSAAN